MKKLYIVVCAGFIAVLLFFTFQGEAVYNHMNTKVKIVRVSPFYLWEETRFCEIPRNALTEDGYVFVIQTEQGYSMTIRTVEKRPVTLLPADEGPERRPNRAYIADGLTSGEIIVSNPIADLADGQRVVIDTEKSDDKT